MAVLAARFLRNVGNLKVMVAEKAVGLLPPGLQGLAKEAIANGQVKLPSWDSRLVLVVDTALMLHRRSHARSTPAVRYGVVDSSPQAGHDWLIARVRAIPKHALSTVFETTALLAQDAKLSEDQGEMSDMEEPDLSHEVLPRAALFQVLHSSSALTTLPPVALGLGHTSLEDKVSALLAAMAMEVDLSYLTEYLSSFMSLTTDMGTEVGIGEYGAQSVERLLPPHILSSHLEAGGDAGFAAAHLRDFLFRNVPSSDARCE